MCVFQCESSGFCGMAPSFISLSPKFISAEARLTDYLLMAHSPSKFSHKMEWVFAVVHA